ncbi:hypothetical protein HCN44_003441 [Aphidius gifuensis]|uniref:Uncharacterized protein n=1 Tax=Aphidius gifuensis TaxID=684658 RepID=A0A834XJZ1_APHGI|nr:uncharacterized protein LOC122859498 isoform X2 [Aphidius gifuensis]KAF7987578.1 hypothetical protein HCN44_003441 [Aphidius gifuensis]
MKTFIIFGLFVAVAMAVPMPEADNEKLNCFDHEDSLLPCLAVKANSMIARAARSSNINIIPGVHLVADKPLERSAKSLETETEKEVMGKLSDDPVNQTVQLASKLYESASSLLNSHSLKVDLSESSISRSFEEARTKLKKTQLFPIIGALGAKFFFLILPVVFGGLSLLVLKSLFFSKLALILAGVLGFQKFFGSGSNVGSYASNLLNKVQPASTYYDNANQAWQNQAPAAQPTQGGYYKRSIDDQKIAQNLAYSAHVSADNNPSS